MPGSKVLSHIQRGDDGATFAVWGSYVLKTAFQPIFAFENGQLNIAAFEGLIRPFRDGMSVPPSRFFSLVPVQDRFSVETVTRTLHLLNAGAGLDQSASIFVNFDPSLFCERSVAEAALRDMRLVLHETGIAPHRIVCEMTEQVSASEPALFAFVEMLRAHGLRIAVDDYGADSSDIRRIEQLKPDIIKFDAQWITYLMESGVGFALLKTMVQRFRDEGIQTVFEGIEETWQLDLAAESGASMVQGFALARPQLAPSLFSTFNRAEPTPPEQPTEREQPAALPREEPEPAELAAHQFFPRTARPKVFGRRVAAR